MAITYRQLQARVRMFLGEPHPNAPSEPVLWRHLADQAQLLFNQTLNQPASWAVDNWRFTVDADNDVYQINAANFGKDLLIETVDDADPNHIPRPVRRMSVSSAILGGEANYAGFSTLPGNGEKHSAQTIALFRRFNLPYLQVHPKPLQSAEYRVWYELEKPAASGDSNSLDIPGAGEAYLTALIAASVLPLTEWPGLTFEQNSQRRRGLAQSLAITLPQQEKAWRSYISNDRQTGVVVLRGFDDAAYGDAW